MMVGEGWQFTVVIPSWTTHIISEENVVLYRVEVRVQPPGSEHTKSRSVLRRFSDFRRLNAALRAKMPARMKGKEVPSKKAFMRVNSNVDLIEKRRRQLEEWLWALLGDSEISSSRELANFLELQAAAGHPLRAQADGAVHGGYAVSERSSAGVGSSGADELEDGCEQASTAGSDLASTVDTSAEASGVMSGSQSQQCVHARAMRMGLRVEQRPNVRRLLQELSERLVKAKADLEDAVETAECERRARESMAEQLAEAMSRLQTLEGPGASSSSGERDRGGTEALRAQLEEERERSAQLEAELERVTSALDRERSANGEPSKEAAEAERARERDAAAEREAALRSDMKVLAKEVKKLRREKAALEARAEELSPPHPGSRGTSPAGGHAPALEDCRQVIGLMRSLRDRMAACDTETMLREGEGDGSLGSEVDDLVATSNNRIAALLAESQLLRTPPHGAVTEAADDLRSVAADLLTDVGLLRQQLNNSAHVAL